MPLHRSPETHTPKSNAKSVESTEKNKNLSCGICNRTTTNPPSTQCNKCKRYFHDTCLKTRPTKNSAKVICDACDRQTRGALPQSSAAKTASPLDKQPTPTTGVLTKFKNDLMKEIKLIREDNRDVLVRLDALVGNVGGIESKLEQLNTTINGILDRVVEVENELGDLKKKCTGFESEFASLKRKVDHDSQVNLEKIKEVLSVQAELEKSMAFISDRFDQLEPQIVESNKVENVNIESAVAERVHKLEAALNKEQQQARNNNLIITGLIKTTNPETTFWKIVEALDCNDAIKPEAVECIEILKAKRPKIDGKSVRFLTDTMLVKFRDKNTKIHLVKKKKFLGVAFAEKIKDLAPKSRNGAVKPREIFFRDHLTEYGMRLFEKSREAKAALNYKYLWTIDGQIFMRKTEEATRIKISSCYDLDRLTPIQGPTTN